MFVIFCISSHHTQGTFVFVVCSIQFQGNGRWVCFCHRKYSKKGEKDRKGVSKYGRKLIIKIIIINSMSLWLYYLNRIKLENINH